MLCQKSRHESVNERYPKTPIQVGFGAGAGGGSRTHKPLPGAVFETAAYTVPPRRLGGKALAVYAVRGGASRLASGRRGYARASTESTTRCAGLGDVWAGGAGGDPRRGRARDARRRRG